MISTKLYPGMCDAALEFFYIKEEKKLMVIHDGKVINYDDLPKEKTEFLKNIIDNDIDVKIILEKWFSSKEDQKKKLAECRFGGLNFQPDYSNDTYSPDSYDCNIRGTCEGFGIVCKPLEHNGHLLDPADQKAIRLLVSSKKNTVIAEELNLPPGSFEVYRTKLYNALSISTKQELASVAFFLGLI